MPFPLYVVGSLAIAALTMTAAIRLSGRAQLSIGVAAIGATALFLFHSLGYLTLVRDDAFITFRYASNFADGLGPNWNSEGRVEGYTSFLWMALLAGLAKIGIDIVVAAQVLGFLFVGATAFVIYRLWKLWGSENEGSGLESPIVFAVVLVGIALNSSVADWAASGMETPLFMLLLTSGAYLHLTERRSGGPPWSALVFAAAAMTRPEGLIAVAVTGLFKLLALRDADDRARATASLVLWSSVFLAVYGSYFLWRYSYYDYLLPNTFYAKVGPSSALFERGLDYVYDNGLRYQALPMLIGTAYLMTRPSLRHDGAYIVALCGALLTAIVFEGGDFMAHGRFLTPQIPLLYLGGITGFAMMLKRLAPDPTRALIVTMALSLAALTLVQTTNFPTLAKERSGHQAQRVLGQWFAANTPEDYTIAAFAVGVVSYYAERDVLDLLGINDVTIAHTDVPDIGLGIPGHEKYNIDYVFEQSPELITISGSNPHPMTEEDIVAANTIVAARNELFHDPRLLERYELRWIYLDGRWFTFLQRRDTLEEFPAAPGMPGAVSYLDDPSPASVGGWGPWRSELTPSEEGVRVTSDEVAYSAFQSSDPGLTPVPGQTYVAFAWVKATEGSGNGQIEIVVRDDGSREGETFNIYPLREEWQLIWVAHTVKQADASRLDVHLLGLGEIGKANAFIFRDAQLRLITE